MFPLMGNAGSASATFRRAIERRNALAAWTSACELGRLSLPDALELVILLAEAEHPRFERASVRLLGRVLLERPRLDLTDAHFIAASLRKLGGKDASLASTALRSVIAA
jgi:hypothetical protein